MEVHVGALSRNSPLQGTPKDCTTSVQPIFCWSNEHFISVGQTQTKLALVSPNNKLFTKQIEDVQNFYKRQQLKYKEVTVGFEELVLEVKCGEDFFVILTKKHQCWFVGKNKGFLEDQNYDAYFSTPKLINSLKDVKSVHTGFSHCHFLMENGDLYFCGQNYHFQFDPDKTQQTLIKKPTFMASKIKKVFKSFYGPVITINTDDEIIPYGKIQFFQLTPQLFEQFQADNVKQIVTNSRFIFVLQHDLDMYISVLSKKNQKVNGINFFLVPFSQNHQIKQIESHIHSIHILLYNGTFYTLPSHLIKSTDQFKQKYKINFLVHHFHSVNRNIYFYKSHTPLEMDFLDFFESEVLADMDIHGIKCHSNILKLRTNLEPEKIKEILEKKTEKGHILSFLKTLYTGIVYDMNNYYYICKELSLNPTPVPIKTDIQRIYTECEDEKDFTIILGDEHKIKVHKWFLAVRSNLFRFMFSEVEQDMTEMNESTGKTFREMQIIIHFLYTGEITFLESDNVLQIYDNLLDVVNFYQLNENIGFTHKLFNQRQKYKLSHDSKVTYSQNQGSGSSKKSSRRRNRKKKRKKKNQKKKNNNK
ncbi:hypothetical protein M0812_15136 [Anaeramoeba flamelloides]|uniref:BTB domain-containing protein n=1 Tax=Anaeramoeba flamelloides TaxID=1746091 RepID=A0AAV7ZD67_9EUKA|nr:hypothetical protein M0812_15136 [Anaeramoeba flamelloides]